MSLDKQERRRRPYERDDDYRVMRFKTWCDSKGFSVPTGRRLVRSGKGPRIVQLSERTIGVTVKDDREWTEARIRADVDMNDALPTQPRRGGRSCKTSDIPEERS
jgi:hypothetical protein